MRKNGLVLDQLNFLIAKRVLLFKAIISATINQLPATNIQEVYFAIQFNRIHGLFPYSYFCVLFYSLEN